MKTVSGKDFCRLLEREGWDLIRVHGSHHIYGKSGHRARLSVPVHGNKPLCQGILHALLKSAELDDLTE